MTNEKRKEILTLMAHATARAVGSEPFDELVHADPTLILLLTTFGARVADNLVTECEKIEKGESDVKTA